MKIFFFKEFFRPYRYFLCTKEKRYISLKDVCNEIVDCSDAIDELYCQEFKEEKINCFNFPKYYLNCTERLLDVRDYLEQKIIFLENGNIYYHPFKIIYNVVLLKFKNVSLSKYWEFFKWYPNIVSLYLINNNLTNMSNIFSTVHLNNLQNLTINENPIKSLSLKDKQLTSLLHLDISKTNIKIIDHSFIRNFQNLKYFISTENLLEKYEKNTFNYLKNIEEIHLNNSILPKNLSLFLNLSKSVKLKKFFTKTYQLCCIFKNFKYPNCQPKYPKYFFCKMTTGKKLINIFIYLILIIFFIFLILYLILYILNYKNLKKMLIFNLQFIFQLIQIIYFLIHILNNPFNLNNIYFYKDYYINRPICFIKLLLTATFLPIINTINYFIFKKNNIKLKKIKFCIFLLFFLLHLFQLIIFIILFIDKFFKKNIFISKYCNFFQINFYKYFKNNDFNLFIILIFTFFLLNLVIFCFNIFFTIFQLIQIKHTFLFNFHHFCTISIILLIMNNIFGGYFVRKTFYLNKFIQFFFFSVL